MSEKEKKTLPLTWEQFCRIAYKARFELDRAEFIRRLQQLEAEPQPQEEAA